MVAGPAGEGDGGPAAGEGICGLGGCSAAKGGTGTVEDERGLAAAAYGLELNGLSSSIGDDG
jgi:hypothetical protein